MQKKQIRTIRTLSLQSIGINRLFLAACMMLATLLFALFSNVQTSYADVAPGGDIANPVVRAVDIAEPAVVRILTNSTGHLIVNFASGNVSFPRQGPGYQLTLSGSGTFITAHGDILTADHVVNPPAQDPGIAQAFDQAAAQDVALYINQHQGGPVTADQVNQELQSGQLASTPQIDSNQSEVFLSTSYSGPLTANNLSALPAGLSAPVDKIEKESAFNQEDVAIIHVALTDMASVPLGDSSSVQQQDNLTIIGFPGNGDVSDRPTDFLTASVNQISVSSIKTTDTGAPVIQVGGNVEHGDSGGPALDSTGAVVGIVSFGISSPGSTGSTSFLQASNSARALVQALNLDTTPGTFQQEWSRAFTDYASTTPGHWHKALSEFQRIASAYPLFKAITPYLNYTQAQAANEKSPSGTPTANSGSPSGAPALNGNSLVSIVLTGLVVLLLIALVVILVRLAANRGKRADATHKRIAPMQPGLPPNAINTPPLNGQSRYPTMQPPPVVPPADSRLTGMSAFGAPAAPTMPAQYGSPPQYGPTINTPPNNPGNLAVQGSQGTPSAALRPWPCGHLNRSNARFCSICGEPAPMPPMRQVEQ
jgi:S1-C subfamily serine protease